MILKDFHAFFETVTAINLGYAGFENFRNGIGTISLELCDKIYGKFSAKHDRLKNKITLSSVQTDPKDKEHADALKKVYDDYKEKYKQVKKDYPDVKKITTVFWRPFLFSGLSTFAILIAIGFEPFINDDALASIFITCTWFFVLYNLVVFFKSLNPSYLDTRKAIIKPLVFLCFIYLTAVGLTLFSNSSLGFENYFYPSIPKGYKIMIITIIINVLPYILFIIRITKFHMDAVKPFKVDSKEAHDILDSINTERTAQLKTLTLLQNYGNNHNPVK